MTIAARRSRMRRVSTGKSIAITPRDVAIFRALENYRYLRSTYLHAFAGGASEKRFKERLTDLYHGGYIDRPAKQWEFARARYQPAVYEIGERARQTLLAGATDVPAPRTYLSSAAHRQFFHALMICECLASIELAVRGRPDLRFIPWAEILSRAPKQTQLSPMPFRIPLGDGALIPDGIFGLEYLSPGKSTYRFFAVEADRGTMPVVRADPLQSSYLAKLAAYREVLSHGLAKRHWGVSTFLVLTVTVGTRRLQTMLQTCREQMESPHFLFRAVDPLALANPMGSLLTEPWGRASSPPVLIARAD